MRLSSTRAPSVARLGLFDFRSYAELDLEVDTQLVALVGENGAGKTNLIEALSLFTPGRGLRRAEFSQMLRTGGSNRFALSLTLQETEETVRLGVGFEASEGGSKRISRIDGVSAPSPAAFAERLRVVWLTPASDGLFSGSPGDRRRFLDRFVLAVDAGHAARVNAMDRALRSRNRILQEDPGNKLWLDAAEREAAELAIAVGLARTETVDRLSALIAATRNDASPFPWCHLAMMGDFESLIASHAALEGEEVYRNQLRSMRARDRAAGRTLAGPHTSDLAVGHGPKNIDAALCSTGEQKALLIGLVLAHAALVAAMSGLQPLILLDEVTAHLDPRRRSALFEALDALGGQVWMTGADAMLFANLSQGQTFEVRSGQVKRLV